MNAKSLPRGKYIIRCAGHGPEVSVDLGGRVVGVPTVGASVGKTVLSHFLDRDDIPVWLALAFLQKFLPEIGVESIEASAIAEWITAKYPGVVIGRESMLAGNELDHVDPRVSSYDRYRREVRDGDRSRD